jgi:phosphatidylserine decarboxylase
VSLDNSKALLTPALPLTLRSDMMKFASEGYSFIIFFGLVTVAAAFFGGGFYAVPPLILTLFMLHFFRDPDRHVPDDKGVFVSPADGKVIVTRDVHESKYLHADAKEISIFMSPMDVHVNRAPCDGRIKTVKHNEGRFYAAYKDEASVRNENIEMVIETEYGDVLVRQVAGFVARRAVCRKKEGDLLKRGERYGIIKFSSRVDMYVPGSAKVRIKPGDAVKAGETIIGEMPD